MCNIKYQVSNSMFTDELVKYTCHVTDLINRDFGTLSNLSEGQLSVVCRTSESHLESK